MVMRILPSRLSVFLCHELHFIEIRKGLLQTKLEKWVFKISCYLRRKIMIAREKYTKECKFEAIRMCENSKRQPQRLNRNLGSTLVYIPK